MSNERETLQKARDLITRNILADERPEPDEMSLMSEPYKRVWEEHDNPPPDDLGSSCEEDWADVLDSPKKD